MSYVIQCQCGQQMTVEDQHAGHSAVCVNCHATFQVPPKPLNPADVASVAGPSAQSPPSVPGGSPSGVRDLPATWYKPHRAAVVLGLGITSLVFVLASCCCCGFLSFIPGIAAVLMGTSDLSDMNSGRMDPSGKSLTQAGIALAVVAMVMTALFMVFGAAQGLGGAFRPGGMAPPGFPRI